MCHIDAVTEPIDGAPSLVDLQGLRRHGNWGMFHELGHNRQESTWTFDGTVEVTCNLFTLYSMEQLVHIEPWDHPWLQPHKTKASAYIAAGAHFGAWKSSPEMALVCYVLLQRRFGWDAYKSVFKRYVDLEDVPDSELGKVFTFEEQFSVVVGQDLRPFFRVWGWPVNEGDTHTPLSETMAHLPPAKVSADGQLLAPRQTRV